MPAHAALFHCLQICVPSFRSTSRIDLIRLTPPENVDFSSDCSTSVIVSAISKERTRNTAIVFAEDKRSSLILRCDVIVDIISSLNLVTTTRELYMEEAPEAFEVRAYDDQGTVEILEFHFFSVLTFIYFTSDLHNKFL
jgi:nuclear pore complex protein Nup210